MTSAAEHHNARSVGLLEGTTDRARLLAAGAMVVGIIAQHRVEPLLVALAVAFSLAVATRCPASSIVHRLRHVEGFLLLLLVLLPFSVPGDPMATMGPFTASWQGLTRAVAIALKVNAAALVILALVTRLEPARLGTALTGLGCPSGLAQLLVLTQRYVEVFRAEFTRLIDAMRARGFVAGSNRHTWTTLGNLAGMMLVRALDRAERVEEAMRARGFSGRLEPQLSPPFNAADRGLLLASVVACLGLLAAAWP
jgi:cobalt/nickel transport system permease protein